MMVRRSRAEGVGLNPNDSAFLEPWKADDSRAALHSRALQQHPYRAQFLQAQLLTECSRTPPAAVVSAHSSLCSSKVVLYGHFLLVIKTSCL